MYNTQHSYLLESGMLHHYGYRRSSAKRPYKLATPMKMYNAEDVWAAAAAAFRFNGGLYYKEPQYKWDEAKQQSIVVYQPNKVVTVDALEGRIEITAQDRELGEEVRNFYRAKLFDVLADNASGYVQSAVNAAGLDEIGDNDRLNIAIISSLPASHVRDIKRETVSEIRERLSSAGHAGAIGDRVEGDFEIVDCGYSAKWNLYYVTAVREGKLFFFFLKQQIDSGKTYKIKGTIKALQDGSVTQLNRVKVLNVA
jgi:hypothetical protein